MAIGGSAAKAPPSNDRRSAHGIEPIGGLHVSVTEFAEVATAFVFDALVDVVVPGVPALLSIATVLLKPGPVACPAESIARTPY